jgi:hypothetical protein
MIFFGLTSRREVRSAGAVSRRRKAFSPPVRTTTCGSVAGHGSSSPFDIRIRLTAAGPALKQDLRSSVPTGNIDLAVTLCHLHGVKPASSMAGRVLAELRRDGPPVEAVRVERIVHRVATETASGRYPSPPFLPRNKSW